MRTFRLGGAAVLAAGVLADAVADPLIDARNGQPAVVPLPIATPTQTQTGRRLPGSVGGSGLPPFLLMGVAGGETLPPLTTTGTWSGAQTTTPNSTANYTFSGVAVEVVLAGNRTSGGIAWLSLDGSPRLAMDTAQSANPAVQTILCPTGGTHTVTIAYYGDLAAGITPISQPVNSVGTSVAPLLIPVRQARGGTTTATWTIAQTTDSTHVSINGSGSYALGTTVTGVIPGVALTLQGGTLTTGDAATFTTTATGISILALNVAVTEATDASWTSPIVGADGTAIVPATGGGGQPTVIPLPLADPALRDNAPLQWLALGWEEDPAYPITAGWGATGNALRATDPSWSITQAADGFDPTMLAISHDGLGGGWMGLAVLPRGVYCQVQVSIPQGGYLRNPRLYAWDPDMDPDARRYPAVPGRETGDDLAMRLYGALAVGWAATERDPMRELLASMSLGGAVGAYLDQHGAEWGMPRPYGMDDAGYQQLLRFLSAARTQGGTLGFFQRALSIILGPSVPFTVQPLNGATESWVLGTSTLGVDTVLGSATQGAWQVLLAFTVRDLLLPPQTLQQIIDSFTPVGVAPVFAWQ